MTLLVILGSNQSASLMEHLMEQIQRDDGGGVGMNQGKNHAAQSMESHGPVHWMQMDAP